MDVGCDRMFIHSCHICLVQRNTVYGVYGVQMNVRRVINSLMLTKFFFNESIIFGCIHKIAFCLSD